MAHSIAPDPKDQSVPQEYQDLLGLPVTPAIQDPLAPRVIQARWDQRVRAARLARLDPLDLREKLDQWVLPETKESRAIRVQQDRLGPRARPVTPAIRDPLVPPVRSVLRDRSVRKVQRDQQARLVRRVLRGR